MSSQILPVEVVDRIMEMAWEDRTPFDAIFNQLGLREADVIKLMRREMKASSFKMWRARVQGRKTKHRKHEQLLTTFKSDAQRHVSNNKIAKR